MPWSPEVRLAFLPCKRKPVPRQTFAEETDLPKGAPLMTPYANAQTPTGISGDIRVLRRGCRLRTAVVIATASLAVWTICIPSRSPSTGKPSDVTLAIAWEDRPSGVCFDRQFDWPTGEAIWIDVPLWGIQVICVAGMVGALAVHHRGSGC